MPDDESTHVNGNGGRPRLRGSLKLPALAPFRDPAVDRGTQLAELAARQLRQEPGAAGGFARFLIAHVRWILITTLAVVGAAAAWAHHQTPEYSSSVQVVTYFTPPDPAAVQGPNMVDEKAVVASQAVLSVAASRLHVSWTTLRDGVSVSVPASSSILEIGYANPVPWIAQQRAQVIADAYVSYRTPPPSKAKPAKTGASGSAPVVSTLQAKIITPAAVPTKPSSPKYVLDILAALILGLGLGVGTAALRDHLDDRVRGPADLEAQTGAPVLSLVPGFRQLGRAPDSDLAMVSYPGSVVAEAYRSLRTRVTTAAAAQGARTLLVTSPGWENKGSVAANLAVALARSGRRTVLVGADLRWGRTEQLLGIEGEAGLTTLLDRKTDLMTALRATGVRGLYVLPAGPRPPDPAEFIQRPALRTVIGEIRSNAGFVVIDAPPVLASSETSPLTQLAEMVLLVADARMTTRAQLRAATRELEGAVGKLIGCVLCDVGRRRWLAAPARPADSDDSAGSDTWLWREGVDGHEAGTAHHPTKSIAVTTGPSEH